MSSAICSSCHSKFQGNGTRCAVCKAKHTSQPNNTKQTAAIYGTARWQALRKAKKRINPLCEDCKERGIVRPVAIVDHVIEIKDGGPPFDIHNTRSLCRSCHGAKTARAARAR